MKNITRHTGTLKIVRRMRSSRSGNPQYMLALDGYTFRTPANSMLGFTVVDMDGARVTATIGTHRGCLTLNQIEEVEINA